MDPQLIDMIRDRFDALDASLKAIHDDFNSHTEQDMAYWKMIDTQRAQVSLLQKMFWGIVGIGGIVGTWLGLKH